MIFGPDRIFYAHHGYPKQNYKKSKRTQFSYSIMWVSMADFFYFHSESRESYIKYVLYFRSNRQETQKT